MSYGKWRPFCLGLNVLSHVSIGAPIVHALTYLCFIEEWWHQESHVHNAHAVKDEAQEKYAHIAVDKESGCPGNDGDDDGDETD